MEPREGAMKQSLRCCLIIVSLFLSIQFSAESIQAGEFLKLKSQVLSLDSRKSGEHFAQTLNHVYYVVQFDGPVQEKWKQILASNEVQFASYFPDDAFLVRIETEKAWLALNHLSHVKSVIPYYSQLRISPELSLNKNSLKVGHGPIKISVKLAFADEFSSFIKTAQLRGIAIVLKGINEKIVILETAKENILPLSEIEGVEWIEPVSEMKTQEFEISAPDRNQSSTFSPGDYTDLTGFESGTKLAGFDGAYALGFHGEGEIVGIADTGLDRGSMTEILDDFKGQIAKGYALGGFAKNWGDPMGHGTHTSGTIVGDGLISGGKLRGGAYGAKLVMQSMWSPVLVGLNVPTDLNDLFSAALINDHVHVHSNSWGSANEGIYDNMSAQVDEISFSHPELLIVFAAGNSGQDLNKDGHIDEGSVSSPATAKNSLSVGASKNYVLIGGYQKMMKDLRGGVDKWGAEPLASSKLSETPNGMAAFSSIGPTKDGRIKPDIVAPGTNMISDRSQDPKAELLWGAYNNFYVYAGGTSMATPLTAAGASLVRQSLISKGFNSPSAALVKAVLMHTATDLFPGQFGTGQFQEFKTTRPNVNEGAGRIDVGSAVSVAANSIIDEIQGLRTGESKSYVVTARTGQVIQATLVYTDAPASAAALVALVNHLNLEVSGNSGDHYFPNHMTAPDNINNSQMISFTAPHDGDYTVSVLGSDVPQASKTGAQPFALVFAAQ
jgi:serine protease AprX